VEFREAAIRGVLIRSLQQYEDARGAITELFRKDDLRQANRSKRASVGDPQMAYISMTKAGQLRGPHEHVQQADVFIFFQAPFDVFMWDNRPGSPTYQYKYKTKTLGPFTQIIVPPGVVHAYRALDQDGLTVNCPDQLYRGWNKEQQVDEIRYEDDAASPFQPW